MYMDKQERDGEFSSVRENVRLMPAGRAAEDFCPHVCRIGEDAGLDLDGAGYE